MAARKYTLEIEGYFRDEVRDRFPDKPGIYFVYKGLLYKDVQTPTVMLNELLSIGETENIHSHLANNAIHEAFTQDMEYGEQIFYTYALTDVDKEDRLRIVSALRYEVLPSLDFDLSRQFEYDETTVVVKGDRHAFVPEQVTAPSYI